MERNQDRKDTLNSKQILMNDPRLMSPDDRLNNLFDKGTDIMIELNTPIMRYYRSTKEILRQADVYIKEGDLEKGYILYIRYIAMLVDKLPTHPEYTPNQDKELINNVFKKTEIVRNKLRLQFQAEYDQRRREIEEQEKKEAERLRREEKLRLKQEEERRKQLVPSGSKTGHGGISTGGISPADEFPPRKPVLPPATLITPQFDEQAQTSKTKKVPSVDRSTKPTSLTTKDGLREIIIPGRLMQNFLRLAASNTSNNIETCGILAGKLERNKLLVTHFLIPKQTGSPDSCTTHNEEDIFDFQDQHDLITLGWIHTHPTQTAFLSSVDLHTHCAYQLMMAEAIAIVCAPKYDETGFFHLTPDYGLNFIANCRENGFHPHPIDPPLFTIAKHYKLDPMASIESVDLRRK